MTYRNAFLISTVLGLSVCLCQVAEAGQGGLPALDQRVKTLENTVAAQQTTVTTQQAATQALTGRVSTLESQVASLQGQIAALQNHLPMFAVVNEDGTLRASSGVLSVGLPLDTSGNPITGHYTVFFSRDVSRCAVTVTAEPWYSGQITASINGTFRGKGIFQPNTFTVVLSDHDSNRINTRFNIIVTC